MGYHKTDIPRGEFGEFSKIQEEFAELLDGREQGVKLLVLCELCDLIGAIEAYAEKHHGVTLADLLAMKDLTKKAFQDGDRT